MNVRQPSQFDLIVTTNVTADRVIVTSSPSDQWPWKEFGATRWRGRSKDRALNSDVTGFDNGFDGASVATPTTGHRVDVPGDYLGLFDREVAADGVVMEGPN